MTQNQEKLAWYELLTPLSYLFRIAEVMPDETAVVCEEGKWTWREYYQRANRLANALKRAGIKRGDRVAFVCRNFPAQLEGYFGVPLAGAVIVAINYRLSEAELTDIINLSGAKILFVDSFVADLVNPKNLPAVETYVNILEGQRYHGEPPKERLPGLDYEEFMSQGSDERTGIMPQDENDLIAIDYTSGTTGTPKGCMYTHRGVYLQCLCQIIEYSMTVYSTYLWTLPMFHCNGWCWAWATAVVGATNVCMRAPDADQIWEKIQQHKVTHMSGPPLIFQRLNQYMNEKGIKKFPHRLIVNNAAAPPPQSMLVDMERKGAEIRHCYGLTEVYGPFTICEWQPKWSGLPFAEQIKRKMRQGVPNVTAGELRIVDPEGNDVPRDGETIGEVIMRGNGVAKGYYQAPEDNARAYRDGWFYTGDGGVMHPDGYIELKDRFKDVIISGGENIVGLEVENCIYQHPDVKEVVCYGVPDEKWGEVVKCLVTPKSGTNPTGQEIIDFCRERLTHFKCPKYVEFGEIPRTSTGKVQKYLLRRKERQNSPDRTDASR